MDLFEKILTATAVLAVGVGVLVLVVREPEETSGRNGPRKMERPAPRPALRRKTAEDSWPDLLELGVPSPVVEEDGRNGEVIRAGRPPAPVSQAKPDGRSGGTPGEPAEATTVPVVERVNMNVQIHSYVGELIARAGPTAAETGKQLIESTNAILRLTGAAVLSKLNSLDDGTLARMANDDDPAVAVNLLGWLRDTGQEERDVKLTHMILERGVDYALIERLLTTGSLDAGGARAALDFMHYASSRADAGDFYRGMAEDTGYDYSVRMKALLLLRDKMTFTDYRDEVNRIAGEARGDPMWEEGMGRLARRLKGPTQFLDGPVAVTQHDIDGRLAREYPAMIEDLALWLEYAASDSKTYVATNTAACLDAYIKAYSTRPWTDWQEVGLSRLETMVTRLTVIEQEGRPKPRNIPAVPSAE